MIIGRGNDLSTPRIDLDVPESLDPEPSALCGVQGHIVPSLVVVRVGKPPGVSRPGNRDSQMVVMRFLNRVHYNDLIRPLELGIHQQI